MYNFPTYALSFFAIATGTNDSPLPEPTTKISLSVIAGSLISPTICVFMPKCASLFAKASNSSFTLPTPIKILYLH